MDPQAKPSEPDSADPDGLTQPTVQQPSLSSPANPVTPSDEPDTSTERHAPFLSQNRLRRLPTI